MAAVRVSYGAAHAHKRLQQIAELQRPIGVAGRQGVIGQDRVVQRSPPNQLHRIERPAVGLDSQLVDRHDVRMLELPRDLGFFVEPRDQLGRLERAGEHFLDGHVAAQERIVSKQHASQAAAGDFLLDDEAADARITSTPRVLAFSSQLAERRFRGRIASEVFLFRRVKPLEFPGGRERRRRRSEVVGAAPR
jgi:hypothetical protein